MDKKKILVVDDESNIRLLVTRLLGKDYIIFQGANGRDAINISRKQKPDLILMDIMMPEMDGYTACSAIKSDHETSKIPIVMLTAVDYPLNRELAGRMGADGYITKPFTLQFLMETIKPLLSAA